MPARPVRAGFALPLRLRNRFGHRQDPPVVVILMFVSSPSTSATGVAGALGQRRFVGRIVLDRQARRASTSRRKACGVCARKSTAGQRFGHASPGRCLASRALHGVARPSGRKRRAVLHGRGDRPRDEIRARERPRRVVNHDHVALLARGAKAFATESWRRAAAVHDPQRLGGAGRYAGGSQRSRRAARRPLRETAGCARNAVTLRSRIARPPTS